MDQNEGNGAVPPPPPPSDPPPPPPSGAPSGQEAPPESKVWEGALEDADVGKRIVAGLIDGIAAFAVGMIPFVGGLISAAYMLTRDGLEIDFCYRRSVGKALMDLKPVRVDGAPVDLMTSVQRNAVFALGGLCQLLLFIPLIGWLFVVPLALLAVLLLIVEIVLIVVGPDRQRLGDKWAGTRVVVDRS